MTRLVCEGLSVRIDDPWAGENNGKKYYLSLNLSDDLLQKFSESPKEEDFAMMTMQMKLNGGKDYSGKIKDLVIESTIQLLEKQKKTGDRPKGRTAKLISEMTGISQCYIRRYCKNRELKALHITDPKTISEKENQENKLACIRKSMLSLLQKLDNYDWETLPEDIGTERKIAEKLIEKLNSTIIEGDEEMKKMTVEYLLEDNQCAYLERIHNVYPHVSEEDIFLVIMTEGSSLDIDFKLKSFCLNHNIGSDFTYEA